jgi:ADP-heptose:LPS heptosyltransferase
VLVLRPGALGDTLLAVPALRALRSRFARVTLAAHGGAARLLAACGEVDRGLAFDDPSLAWVFSGSAPEDEVVAWMNPGDAPGLKWARMVAPSRPADEQHCAAYLVQTLAPLGISGDIDDRPLNVRPLTSEEILVHPGSGSVSKNWPAGRFAETIRALQQPVTLIVGEADDAAAHEVEAYLGQALPRLEHPPLEELAARLAGCRAYLGLDSGVSHLAGLCGARSVVLFGPTSPRVWRPLGPRVHVERFDVGVERLVTLLR